MRWKREKKQEKKLLPINQVENKRDKKYKNAAESGEIHTAAFLLFGLESLFVFPKLYIKDDA